MNNAPIGRDNETTRPTAHAAMIQETTPLDLLKAAHAQLSGRYRFAIPFAITLALLGALAAQLLLKPNYVSTGMLHIAPTSPSFVATDDTPVAPRYESFVSAQATLIASRAVIDRAITSETLIASGWPTGEKGLEKLADSLTVQHRSGDQLIRIMVTAHEPAMAQAAADAILNAYQELYGERNGLSMGLQESAFAKRVEFLENSLAENRNKIDKLVIPFGGADALQTLHDAKIGTIAALDEKMADVLVQQADNSVHASPDQQGYELLAMLASDGKSGVTNAAQASIQDMIREDAKLQQRIESLRARGYGGRHPDVRSLTNAQEEIAKAAEHRKRLVTQIIDSIGLPFANPDGSVSRSPQTLAKLEEQLRSLRERLSTELVTMGNALSSVTRLVENGERIQTRLDRANDQLAAVVIQVDDHSLGQVSIAQDASFQAWAESDRRLAGSAVAAVVLFCFGIGSVIATGFFRPTIGSVRDVLALSANVDLIGVFVEQGKRRADRDALTALSTHETRNALYTDAGTNGTRVFAVASAGESGNQTAVANCLAQSFAMAGYQTLLVDGDLVGAGLSGTYAHDSNARGLRDIIAQGDPNGTVHRTSKPRLWMMPAGASREVTPDTLSADDVALFLDMARKHYDVIVIDAGSATRNIESVLTTAASDRTVIAVDHNDDKSTANDAVRRLERAGAPVAGLVYTGASYEDARRSGFVCERSVAESMYPEGLANPGREAPTFESSTVNAPDQHADDSDSHSIAAA